MNFIYKELVKKYINLLTINDIKKYAKSKNETLTNQEATIIYNYIKKYYNELLEGDTNSFTILKQNLRKELFNKIALLYNEYASKYI